MNEPFTPLLLVNDLRIGFDLPEGRLLAVDGVSFQVRRGGTVALVGESGSGKSVVSQAIMGLLPRPARVLGGSILFADPAKPGTITDIVPLAPDRREMRALRRRRVPTVLQEPLTAMSTTPTIGPQVSQAIMGLLPRPARVLGGSILFADPDKPGTITDIVRLAPDGREMRALRGGRISIVFQEPMTAMSPLHTIGDQVGEALRLHRDA